MNPVLFIVGPTGVGKTALSIALAKAIDGEVVNGDSLQVYRGLDIGTAKVTPSEMEGVVHHLLDVCAVTEPYTASDYKREARKVLQDIHERGKIPIVVGGTGLYVEGLLYDFHYSGASSNDPTYRAAKEAQLADEGPQALWNELQAVDPVSAAVIPVNNTRRVIRALEVTHATGKPFSQQGQQQTPQYNAFLIGLNTQRECLYERINQRVWTMVEAGLEAEARILYEQTKGMDVQSIRGIGYKEWIPYFNGEQTKEAVIERIQQHSRRYAKRQLTWFRNRLPQTKWYDLVQDPSAFQHVLEDVHVFLEKEEFRG